MNWSAFRPLQQCRLSIQIIGYLGLALELVAGLLSSQNKPDYAVTTDNDMYVQATVPQAYLFAMLIGWVGLVLAWIFLARVAKLKGHSGWLGGLSVLSIIGLLKLLLLPNKSDN